MTQQPAFPNESFSGAPGSSWPQHQSDTQPLPSMTGTELPRAAALTGVGSHMPFPQQRWSHAPPALHGPAAVQHLRSPEPISLPDSFPASRNPTSAFSSKDPPSSPRPHDHDALMALLSSSGPAQAGSRPLVRIGLPPASHSRHSTQPNLVSPLRRAAGSPIFDPLSSPPAMSSEPADQHPANPSTGMGAQHPLPRGVDSQSWMERVASPVPAPRRSQETWQDRTQGPLQDFHNVLGLTPTGEENHLDDGWGLPISKGRSRWSPSGLQASPQFAAPFISHAAEANPQEQPQAQSARSHSNEEPPHDVGLSRQPTRGLPYRESPRLSGLLPTNASAANGQDHHSNMPPPPAAAPGMQASPRLQRQAISLLPGGPERSTSPGVWRLQQLGDRMRAQSSRGPQSPNLRPESMRGLQGPSLRPDSLREPVNPDMRQATGAAVLPLSLSHSLASPEMGPPVPSPKIDTIALAKQRINQQRVSMTGGSPRATMPSQAGWGVQSPRGIPARHSYPSSSQSGSDLLGANAALPEPISMSSMAAAIAANDAAVAEDAALDSIIALSSRKDPPPAAAGASPVSSRAPSTAALPSSRGRPSETHPHGGLQVAQDPPAMHTGISLLPAFSGDTPGKALSSEMARLADPGLAAPSLQDPAAAANSPNPNPPLLGGDESAAGVLPPSAATRPPHPTPSLMDLDQSAKKDDSGFVGPAAPQTKLGNLTTSPTPLSSPGPVAPSCAPPPPTQHQQQPHAEQALHPTELPIDADSAAPIGSDSAALTSVQGEYPILDAADAPAGPAAFRNGPSGLPACHASDRGGPIAADSRPAPPLSGSGATGPEQAFTSMPTTPQESRSSSGMTVPPGPAPRGGPSGGLSWGNGLTGTLHESLPPALPVLSRMGSSSLHILQPAGLPIEPPNARYISVPGGHMGNQVFLSAAQTAALKSREAALQPPIAGSRQPTRPASKGQKSHPAKSARPDGHAKPQSGDGTGPAGQQHLDPPASAAPAGDPLQAPAPDLSGPSTATRPDAVAVNGAQSMAVGSQPPLSPAARFRPPIADAPGLWGSFKQAAAQNQPERPGAIPQTPQAQHLQPGARQDAGRPAGSAQQSLTLLTSTANAAAKPAGTHSAAAGAHSEPMHSAAAPDQTPSISRTHLVSETAEAHLPPTGAHDGHQSSNWSQPPRATSTAAGNGHSSVTSAAIFHQPTCSTGIDLAALGTSVPPPQPSILELTSEGAPQTGSLSAAAPLSSRPLQAMQQDPLVSAHGQPVSASAMPQPHQLNSHARHPEPLHQQPHGPGALRPVRAGLDLNMPCLSNVCPGEKS